MAFETEPDIVKILTAIVSVTALVLSQLPPIKQLLKGKRLRMAVSDRANISHVFGNTNLALWFDLENTGGRTLVLQSIRCYLLRDEAPLQPLAANTYVVTESLGQDKPTLATMGEISLKIGDRWSGYINFFDNRVWTIDMEHRVKKALKRVKEDVNTKALALNDEIKKHDPDWNPPNRGLVDADAGMLADLMTIRKDLTKITQGNYTLLAAAYEDPNGKPVKVVGFKFTLHQEDIDEIFDDVDDWKHGFGTLWPARKTNYTWVGMTAQGKEESLAQYNQLTLEMTRRYRGGSGVLVLPT